MTVCWKIIILCLAVLIGNISAGKKPRIINGNDATIEDFPYQASLRHNGQHICGGSIISERHILTAGHCIYSYIVPPYRRQSVVTGTSSRSEGGNFHQIANITVHPGYSTDGNRGLNDVAIITLKDIIVFDKSQQKIELPEENFKVGQEVNLTGWGRTKQIPPVRPEQLQQLQTEILSTEECQQKVIDPKNMPIYDTEVCTNNPEGYGMCLGDSGGPLAANGELVGVVSWTDGDYCAGGHPDVYMNVYKFRDFILPIIKYSVE